MSQPPPSSKEALLALNIVTAIHKLTMKSLEAKDKNALIFLILNDTISAIPYDRAVLWDIDRDKPKLLGVSGQASASKTTEIAKKWQLLVEEIQKLTCIQILTDDHFTQYLSLWKEYTSSSYHPSVLWVPIIVEGKPRLGLWLERWDKQWTPEEANVVSSLAQAYGVAWKRFVSPVPFRTKKTLYGLLALAVLLSLFLVRIPLRVVAPCEVVPKDPILITAPLEDIIERVNVKPGQMVKKDDALAEYDKRVALQSLRIAQEGLRIAQEDLTRARTLAFKDEKPLAEIAVLEAKLKKEQANLALAKYKASQLIIKSPEDGIAMLENPDEWRGKPVRVGEKILTVINPKNTKVRLWIPEADNIGFNLNDPIKVFLNVTPTVNRWARLNFISNASIVTEKSVVSFMAEADWVEAQNDVSPGLKGTAILYGEKVSLFYWLLRKPWHTFREWVGI